MALQYVLCTGQFRDLTLFATVGFRFTARTLHVLYFVWSSVRTLQWAEYARCTSMLKRVLSESFKHLQGTRLLMYCTSRPSDSMLPRIRTAKTLSKRKYDSRVRAAVSKNRRRSWDRRYMVGIHHFENDIVRKWMFREILFSGWMKEAAWRFIYSHSVVNFEQQRNAFSLGTRLDLTIADSRALNLLARIDNSALLGRLQTGPRPCPIHSSPDPNMVCCPFTVLVFGDGRA